MADIVERLRNAVGGPVYDELREAADEIERLKETYPYSELDMDMHVEAVTKDLKAEIEQLRAALKKVRSYNVDIAAGRINYRPQDHLAVIDAALSGKP